MKILSVFPIPGQTLELSDCLIQIRTGLVQICSESGRVAYLIAYRWIPG